MIRLSFSAGWPWEQTARPRRRSSRDVLNKLSPLDKAGKSNSVSAFPRASLILKGSDATPSTPPRMQQQQFQPHLSPLP
jgi:hypothetical protein